MVGYGQPTRVSSEGKVFLGWLCLPGGLLSSEATMCEPLLLMNCLELYRALQMWRANKHKTFHFYSGTGQQVYVWLLQEVYLTFCATIIDDHWPMVTFLPWGLWHNPVSTHIPSHSVNISFWCWRKVKVNHIFHICRSKGQRSSKGQVHTQELNKDQKVKGQFQLGLVSQSK